MVDPLGKLLAAVIGAAFVLGFGWLGLDSLRDYRTFGDAPRRTDLAGAVEASAAGRQWVTVEGSWRCDRLVRGIDGGVAFLPSAVVEGSLVVARFDREIACDSVASRPMTGIVEPMDAKRAADLRAAGLSWPEGARLRTLDVCAFCGKGNARLGIVMCALFVALGVSLYPLRLAYQKWRRRAHEALHGAIRASAGTAAANRTVRVWGAAALTFGGLALVVGRGWVIYRVVPVPWVGVVAVLLGGWMVAFPESYRRVSRRGQVNR